MSPTLYGSNVTPIVDLLGMQILLFFKGRYNGSGLMFYDEPPRCQINLETMETLAVERLRFLRLMEKHASLSGKICFITCLRILFNCTASLLPGEIYS